MTFGAWMTSLVIDSSALLAIVLGEIDADLYIAAITSSLEKNADVYVPASVLVEAGIVAEQRERGHELDELLERIQPEIISIDHAVATLARKAFGKFGRGRHPAKLNFGDCMSYASAQYLRLPLLFKGEDFTQTDIQSALSNPRR